MYERYLRIVGATGERFGRKWQAISLESGKFALNIVWLESNMVDARASFLQKTADLAALTHRFDQLNARIAYG